MPGAQGDARLCADEVPQSGIRRGRREAHEIFAPLPIWEAPYQPRDLRGPADLLQLGRTLFGASDPTKVFFTGKTQEITKVGDEYVLRLPLPHVELDKVNMVKRGDQLFIEIGTFRREMILPMSLAEREATRAVFRNGTLEVRFGPPVPVEV